MASKQRMDEHIRREAARWITERDAGPLSLEQEKAFADWLTADPLNAAVYARLETTWSRMGSDSVEAEIRRRSRTVPFHLAFRPRQWLGGAMAACIALIVVGGLGDWPMQMRADAITATGEQRTVSLADGSTVVLNTGSAVAIDYDDDRRALRLLKGEAAFTVAADPSRPFVVQASDGTTTALGTRFIVRRNGANTDVIVTEHSVRVALPVTPGRTEQVATVGEGQAVRYNADGLAQLHDVDTYAADAWTRGNLVFVNRPLAEVVEEVNRYHPGFIRVVGNNLGERRFSGVFPVGDPMGAIEAIQQSLGIGSTRISDRLIFLHT